jgi:hypothetical protein
MAPIRATAELSVRKEVGAHLMFRSSVNPFFRKIASLDAGKVILDFSSVDFMSRSFADEYLAAKALSKKRVEERNLPAEVRRMLRSVSEQTALARSPPFAPAPRTPFKVAPVTTL